MMTEDQLREAMMADGACRVRFKARTNYPTSGQTAAASRVLAALAPGEVVGTSDIAERMGVHMSTAANWLGRMHRRGLIGSDKHNNLRRWWLL